MAPAKHDYYTVAQAAVELDMSEATVRDLIAARRLLAIPAVGQDELRIPAAALAVFRLSREGRGRKSQGPRTVVRPISSAGLPDSADALSIEEELPAGAEPREHHEPATLKAALTPLGTMEHVDGQWIKPLRDVGITTAEELLGAGHSDPVGLGSLLNLEPIEIVQLLSEIEAEVRQHGGHVPRLNVPKPPFGAWDPNEAR